MTRLIASLVAIAVVAVSPTPLHACPCSDETAEHPHACDDGEQAAHTDAGTTDLCDDDCCDADAATPALERVSLEPPPRFAWALGGAEPLVRPARRIAPYAGRAPPPPPRPSQASLRVYRC